MARAHACVAYVRSSLLPLRSPHADHTHLSPLWRTTGLDHASNLACPAARLGGTTRLGNLGERALLVSTPCTPPAAVHDTHMTALVRRIMASSTHRHEHKILRSGKRIAPSTPAAHEQQRLHRQAPLQPSMALLVTEALSSVQLWMTKYRTTPSTISTTTAHGPAPVGDTLLGVSGHTRREAAREQRWARAH